MTVKLLESLPPTETLEMENGLKLVPRLKLNFTVYHSSPSVSKSLDEWKLKRALIDFLKTSLSVPVIVPEEDLVIKRIKELKTRKREDPLARGTLFVRDLGFLKTVNKRYEEEEEEEVTALEKKFLDWRRVLVEKLDGIELNLEGFKFKLTVVIPESDNFEEMKKAWEEFYAFGNRGYSRSGSQGPDTITLRGAPSRWFAEPRVSSKPSMLVTHTIFSTFGKIRNLNIAVDDDFGKDGNEDGEDIISGLHCKITVQFEKHRDFYNALKVLSGRSLQKQGSRLWADYEVTWEKDGFTLYSRSQTQVNGSRMQEMAAGKFKNEALRRQRYSGSIPDDSQRKRFKE
ncbi:A-kinase anchor protein 17A isoform X1 [Benincasa hispida]|uniref:A-kinase anchor protein 17A isoform X1 n=1 Tax=Benincasa hispida TaxID=102211 RepID=UPI00190005E2|nr:A-kinase anchor protein 17A isoform X1 [Benincasa hispida]